jgi:DNA uptake protein ComE-like DNA-binding protein
MKREMKKYLTGGLVLGLLLGLAFSIMAGEPIDVNTAGPLELERLYRVNPRIAKRIIAEREENGPYLSLEDLAERVREIGPQTIARWAGLAVASP